MKKALAVGVILLCIIYLSAISHLSPSEWNTISISDTVAYADSRAIMQIVINNDEEFVAFQCDIVLPHGLNFIIGSAELTGRAQDHVIQANYVNEDTLRVISFSMNSLPFIGNSGAVAELGFTTNLTPGYYTISLANCLISDPNSQNIINEVIDGELHVLPLTSLSQNNILLSDIILLNNYPNPFNPIINFEIKAEGYKNLQIEIFNIKGQRVDAISNQQITKSLNYQITWNAENYASGVYYCKLINVETNKQFAVQKITLLK